MVKSFKRNGKKYWSRTPIEVLKQKYIDSLDELDPTTEDALIKRVSDSSKITIYRGNTNVINVLREISDLPAKSRFYGIQPEQSLIEAVTKNPIKDMISINHKINSKRLIVEGIVHEKGTDSMINFIPEEDGLKLLKSFANRSADTAKLPDNFLSETKAEIYLYQDKIAIVNWAEEFAVIIKNKDVFALLKEMFNSTKYLLDRYDQNEKIAKKIIDQKPALSSSRRRS